MDNHDINNPVDTALTYFREGDGFNCAQAVVAAYAPQFGLDTQTACKVAGAFGGGMARTGGICGAVSGALVVIGLRYGMTDIEDQQSKKLTYERAREFMGRFRECHKTVRCRGLLDRDINTPEGLKEIKDNKMFATHCSRFIRDAAAILEEII